MFYSASVSILLVGSTHVGPKCVARPTGILRAGRPVVSFSRTSLCQIFPDCRDVEVVPFSRIIACDSNGTACGGFPHTMALVSTSCPLVPGRLKTRVGTAVHFADEKCSRGHHPNVYDAFYPSWVALAAVFHCERHGDAGQDFSGQ